MAKAKKESSERVGFKVKNEPGIAHEDVIPKLLNKEEDHDKDFSQMTPQEKEISIPSRKEVAKGKLKQFIDEETKLVKGRFRCFETPGDKRKIIVKKYPGVPVFEKEMVDGETYEVPLYVARFLNGIDVTADSVGGKIYTCSYPIHGFKWENGAAPPPCTTDSSGALVPIETVVKRTRRYGFESLEFGS